MCKYSIFNGCCKLLTLFDGSRQILANIALFLLHYTYI